MTINNSHQTLNKKKENNENSHEKSYFSGVLYIPLPNHSLPEDPEGQ